MYVHYLPVTAELYFICIFFVDLEKLFLLLLTLQLQVKIIQRIGDLTNCGCKLRPSIIRVHESWLLIFTSVIKIRVLQFTCWASDIRTIHFTAVKTIISTLNILQMVIRSRDVLFKQFIYVLCFRFKSRQLCFCETCI